MDKDMIERLRDLRGFIEEAVGFADDDLTGEDRVKVVDYLDEMSTDLQEFIAGL